MKNILFFILLFGVISVHAAMVKKDITYFSGGVKYTGYAVYDDSVSDAPGVLVTHDWLGVTAKTKEKAELIAALGYKVFAVDVYGANRRPKDQKEAAEIAGSFKKDRVMLRTRMRNGLSQLKKLPGVNEKKLAALGYCFGGTASIELGRSGVENLKAIVSFHGGLDSPKPTDGKRISGKILALHGEDDPFVSASDIAAFESEMKNAGVDYQLIKYPGAVHSFTDKTAGNDNSKGAAYNADADAKSWEEMKKYLSKNL